MLAGQCKTTNGGAEMTSFGWEALAIGLATALGMGFIAVTALGRRRMRRRAKSTHGLGSGRRRIDVVAIDESVVGALTRASTKRITRDSGFRRSAKGDDISE